MVKSLFSEIGKWEDNSVASVNLPVRSLHTHDLAFAQCFVVKDSQHTFVSQPKRPSRQVERLAPNSVCTEIWFDKTPTDLRHSWLHES